MSAAPGTRGAAGQRFVALDGIRGLLAIAVMVYHYSHHAGLEWLHRAWTAVDVFFLLSGFVLCHSYGSKLASGLGFGAFARARILRLYPTYLLGLALGAYAATHQVLSGASEFSGEHVATASVLGLGVVPYLNEVDWRFTGGAFEGAVFPLNDPAWSLFFELFVNAIYAFWVKVKVGGSVWLVLGASLVAYLLVASRLGINGGWGGANFVVGFPRVIYQFFLGVVLYGVYSRHGFRWKFVGPLSLVALVVLFIVDSRVTGMLALFVVAPLVVLSNTEVVLTGSFGACCRWLGDISYPLYIVHSPLCRLAYATTGVESLTPPVQVLLISGASLLVAAALVPVDEAVRRWLGARWRTGKGP